MEPGARAGCFNDEGEDHFTLLDHLRRTRIVARAGAERLLQRGS